jgi:hypothetical protein
LFVLGVGAQAAKWWKQLNSNEFPGNGDRTLPDEHQEKCPEPAKLLKGSGSLMRSIIVEDTATLTHPEVVCLIDEAIARNPVPFAPTGRGSVLIRPTSAKKTRTG